MEYQRAIPHQDFQVSTVSRSEGASKKKALRSGEGTTTISESRSGSSVGKFKRGRHLDTIILNYCTAVGLMEVGVLPKPGLWEYERMKRPAKHTKTNVEPKRIRMTKQEKDEDKENKFSEPKTADLFDLSEIPSDDEA